MPFAFGIDHDGKPDIEARARLDEALAIARDKSRDFDTMIFMGAGMPEQTKPYGAESLAASAAAYLIEREWPANRIIMRPVGYNTVTEACAFYDYGEHCLYHRNMIIGVVSSRWHTIPRVWVVCRIILGRSVEIHVSKTGHSGKTLIYDILREILALPRSILMALMFRISRKRVRR